ncbi:dioxygenase family protein [Mangrovibacterium diazotrophicum]|uniref:Dioxygenase-like protein n=1 Tax=Mangrovibacterium diazotrophicum TaxID=1261403 RepID=A0A419WB00_9BACT|nr:intradiol ring-cleavage dioxygenase [Mangrovibacterium diazotrophicum]RKD92627.1 dioxygenase-like protein [Mangrovibacterium diazotrophicum]
MERKQFLKQGIVGLGSIVGLSKVMLACASGQDDVVDETEVTDSSYTNESSTSDSCELSPSETEGPYPIKTPADLVRENIVSDRSGVALLITLTVVDQSADCAPLADVLVDIWHCDKDGYYSEYKGSGYVSTQVDNTSKHFLRGRQTTDSNGQVSFISIYPGWYQSRAPHIHVEVLNSSEQTIRVTQIAFPKDICDTVYATSGYHGSADTLNASDNVFSDSLDGNLADSISGNTTDGYTLLKTIVV